MSLKSVKVPDPFAPLFQSAEKYVSDYFSKREDHPQNGQILIQGERYILVRASSMSVHFIEFMKSLYPNLDEEEAFNAAGQTLYEMAFTIGKADALNFHQKTNVTDPIAKLSTGPVHFAYTGWAYVDIHAESKPSPDDNYYLSYDHPTTFEADSWLSLGKRTPGHACQMSAGYSAGWCSVSFGISLVAREILCRAHGDQHCRFIMATAERIDEFVGQYKKAHSELFESRKSAA